MSFHQIFACEDILKLVEVVQKNVGSWPRTSLTKTNMNTVQTVVGEDPHLSARAFECLLNISRMTCHQIPNENLNIRQVLSTWVPYMLTREQLNQRVALGKNFLKCFGKNPTFLNCIIMCDKMWIHHFDPPWKHEKEIWKQKEQPCWKKVCQEKFVGKIIVITFWYQKGMIYQHVIPNKKISNK